MLSVFLLTLTAMAGEIELAKGGCYGIRIEPDGTARLEWMLPPRALCAINLNYEASDARLADGDEVAFFPPVTGG